MFRNNSARELSVFVDSAMACNRVVLQHFSMTGDSVVDAYLAAEDKDGLPFGLSPPSESRLVQRRLHAKSQSNSSIVLPPVIATPSG